MEHFKGYIFDLDGTIYLGNQAIKGAVETVNRLQSLNKKLLFLTNKTIESRENYVKKLNGLGIAAKMDNLLNPALVTIQYLKKNYPGAKVYVIGEPVLIQEIVRNGISLSDSPEETDVVVVSWDRDFHYRHLDFAFQSIALGAHVIATHPDRTCPVAGGELPDCGGMIGAIEGVTGKKIDVIMGKPSALMALTALDIMQIHPSECLMTGDRLETDILMGQLAGMNTALVLSGVTRREDVDNVSRKPDYVLNSVYDIYANHSAGVDAESNAAL